MMKIPISHRLTNAERTELETINNAIDLINFWNKIDKIRGGFK